MAAASCQCSSVVSVGNIAYSASESELRDACEEIGPVVSLRVATDEKHGTGRPRGFAFYQYLDDETARSACRNLHGHPLRGRALRVCLVERQRQRQVGRRGSGLVLRHDPRQPVGVEDATQAASLVSGSAPRDAVTRYLAGLSRRQLRELVDAVEREGPESVERAKRAKREYAGLATLIEQARILLNMAAAPEVSAKRPGGSLESGGRGAPKARRLDGGKPVACR